jgi:serine/threonine protein kinase
MHGDVKLENMLIASDGRAVLSDLGSARNLQEGPSEVTVIFTRDWAHPKLRALVSYAASTDPNRLRGQVQRNELRKSFDLYALGQNLRRLLRMHDMAEWKELEPYERKYFELTGTRLLDGVNSDDECALGLPRAAFEEIKYTDADQIATDLKKLTGEYPLRQIVPELDLHPIQTIQTSSLSPSCSTGRQPDGCGTRDGPTGSATCLDRYSQRATRNPNIPRVSARGG